MMERQDSHYRNNGQLIWGIALLLAGVGVLLRNMDVMPRLAEFESHSKSVEVIFYFIGLVLIYGGAKKIVLYFRKPGSRATDSEAGPMNSDP